MGNITRIDRGANKVIGRFQKGHLLWRAEVHKIPDLPLASFAAQAGLLQWRGMEEESLSRRHMVGKAPGLAQYRSEDRGQKLQYQSLVKKAKVQDKAVIPPAVRTRVEVWPCTQCHSPTKSPQTA